MAWNPKYAAYRYFRKRGDTLRADIKLLIYNTPPDDSETHTCHAETLRKLGCDFTNSLFIDNRRKA